jgi:mono/diheme cytochrome c family protein
LTGFLVVFATAGCGGDDEAEEPTPPAERPTETAPQEEPALAAGKEIFADQGCAGCHTLAAADASGRTGPNLDDTLKGESEQQIRRSIVEPNADITKGFSPGVMPQDFGERLSPHPTLRSRPAVCRANGPPAPPRGFPDYF